MTTTGTSAGNGGAGAHGRAWSMRAAALTTFGATGLTVLLTFGTSVLLARNLGPDGRGLLLVLTFWPTLLAGLTNLSLNEAMAYHVARRDGLGDEAGKRQVEMTGLALQLVTAFASVGVCLLLIAALLPAEHRSDLGNVLWYAAFFAPLSVLDQHFKAVLQGRGQFGRFNAMRLVQPIAYLGLLAWLALRGAMDVRNVMLVMLLALGCSAVASAFFAREWPLSVSRVTARQLVTSGLSFHGANVLLYAASEIDKLLVLQLVDTASAGLYTVALGVSSFGSGLVVQSVGPLLARRVSATSEPRQQAAVLVRAIHIAMIGLLVINTVAAVLAPWWLPLVFGQAFAPAVPVAMVLLMMATVRGVRQVLDRGMRAAHVTRTGILGEGVALVASLMLATVGCRIGGLVGLSAGLLVAQFLACAVMMVSMVKYFDLDAKQLWPLRRETIDAILRIGGVRPDRRDASA